MKIDKVEQITTINYHIKVIHESWVKYMYLKHNRLNPYGTPYLIDFLITTCPQMLESI